MMLCATVIQDPTGYTPSLFVVPVDSPPADLSSCPLVIPSGLEWGSIDPSALGITPEVLGYVLAAGFAIPLAAYLMGLGVAIALNLIRQIG